MNWHGLKAIYLHEMDRMRRTLFQSLVSPFISTSLYFVVFGSAIGSRITEIEGISYGSFIVPGMIMLTILTQSISNASFGIFFPKFTNTVYEILAAPLSSFEKLQLIPILIITPLVFLGGSFYSINMLPEFWQKVSLLNPVLYLVSGFRWSFYEIADVSIFTSLITMLFFLFSCVLIISYTFAKGYKIKN